MLKVVIFCNVFVTHYRGGALNFLIVKFPHCIFKKYSVYVLMSCIRKWTTFVLLLQAEAAIDSFNYDEAETRLEEILQVDTDNCKCLEMLASIYIEKFQWPEAVDVSFFFLALYYVFKAVGKN